MQAGISTACFYPQPTEETLERIAALGFDKIEVFVNSPSESTERFARALRRKAEKRGLEIIAFHPFSSFAESYCLFSGYERRREDFLEIYRRYFSAAAAMGARVFNFHGAFNDFKVTPEAYCEIYSRLNRLAASEGVTLSQENVSNFHAGHTEFIAEMRRLLGDEVRFTLDIKQAMRLGIDPCFMRDTMGDALTHVHISDFSSDGRCELPGKGVCDYEKIFSGRPCAGDVSRVVEVYSCNFSRDSEITEAKEFLTSM